MLSDAKNCTPYLFNANLTASDDVDARRKVQLFGSLVAVDVTQPTAREVVDVEGLPDERFRGCDIEDAAGVATHEVEGNGAVLELDVRDGFAEIVL